MCSGLPVKQKRPRNEAVINSNPGNQVSTIGHSGGAWLEISIMMSLKDAQITGKSARFKPNKPVANHKAEAIPSKLLTIAKNV